MMNESDAIAASILDDDEEEEIFEVNHDKPAVQPRQKRPHQAKWTWCGKFLKTLGLSAAFLALGLCLAVPGVTLLDLKERVGTTIEYISYIFTARSVGYLFGSILGGFLFDHFDQQLQLSYTLLLTSVATITAPWCSSLIVLAVMISFQGIAMGVLDTGGNVFCIRIWGRQSGPYIQAMHFAFGIGAFIAPLLAKPFLSPIMMNSTTPIISHSHLQVHIPGISSKQHMLFLRDIQSSNSSNLSDKYNQTLLDESLDNSSMNAIENSTKPTLLLSTPPRPKKPNSANGALLGKDYADGSKIQDHLRKSKETEKKKLANKLAILKAKSMPAVVTPARVTNQTGLANNSHTTAAVLLSTTPNTSSTITVESVLQVTVTKTTPLLTTTHLKEITTDFKTTTTDLPLIVTTPKINSSNNSSKKDNSSLNSYSNTLSMSTSSSTMATSTITTTTFHPQKPETFDKILNNAIHAVKTMSNIQFVYMIIGVFLFFISIFFMCLYCYDKSYETLVTYRCDRKHKSCFEEQGFRVQTLIALFIFFFIYVGMEVTFGGFIMTFAVEQFGWSKDDGVILTSLFWGALAAGRGLSIFIARCCLPCWMLVTNMILVLTASLMLSFGLSHYQVLLWVGTLLFGLGLSSMFPTGMSWAENYMTMTGKATAVLIVGSALGEMVIPAVTGFFFVKKQKMVLMYIMFSLSLLSCLCFIIMQNLASNQGRKYDRNNLLSLEQQQVSLMNGSTSDMSLSCGSDVTRRKHVTFKLDHERVKYNRLHSSDEE